VVLELSFPGLAFFQPFFVILSQRIAWVVVAQFRVRQSARSSFPGVEGAKKRIGICNAQLITERGALRGCSRDMAERNSQHAEQEGESGFHAGGS
jgi:hypothetical protein